jgi:hypothetical protein
VFLLSEKAVELFFGSVTAKCPHLSGSVSKLTCLKQGRIIADFARLGPEIWDGAKALDRRNDARKQLLGELNGWRNAIAHQDFDPAMLGSRPTLRLSDVNGWRRACYQLARAFDAITRTHLNGFLGLPLGGALLVALFPRFQTGARVKFQLANEIVRGRLSSTEVHSPEDGLFTASQFPLPRTCNFTNCPQTNSNRLKRR